MIINDIKDTVDIKYIAKTVYNFKGQVINMNYLKEVAEKILQVGIGEEFKIILDGGDYSIHNPFKFTETDLVNNDGDILNGYISTLITGDYKIEKIPFVPKVGENYCTYYNSQEIYIETYCWSNSSFDKERKLLVIIFRTKQEAKDYLPTWLKRLEGEK